MQAEIFNIIKDNYYFGWFALLLFFIGFCASFLVEYFDIKILKSYPAWFMGFISRFVGPQFSFIRIFTFIFLFNSIFISIYMFSGILVIFPFIIAFLTGMNIGITMFIPQKIADNERVVFSGGKALKIMLFSTLVLILEILAFSLALGMGMSLAVAVASSYKYISIIKPYIIKLLLVTFKSYIIVCVPILCMSAFLEAAVIKEAEVKEDGQ